MGGIQCWWYLLSGIESWRYSFGGIESWRYFLAVTRVGGAFLADAVKPEYGGIFFGGNATRRYCFGGRRFSVFR